MQHQSQVPASMLNLAKKLVARRKAKRKNLKTVNGIHLAHRVAIVVNQVIQAAEIRPAAAIQHHLQVTNCQIFLSQKRTHPPTHIFYI